MHYLEFPNITRRRESEAIPSAYHLAWLALDTYKRLFPEKQVSQLLGLFIYFIIFLFLQQCICTPV